jgi:hypothetical protein
MKPTAIRPSTHDHHIIGRFISFDTPATAAALPRVIDG